MKKVNLFEELLRERNKQISSNELKSLIKDIWHKEDFKKKLESGALLVQIYTGFIIKGPRIVSDILN